LAHEAVSLLPRCARLDGPTPIGENPAELLASAQLLLRRICVVVHRPGFLVKLYDTAKIKTLPNVQTQAWLGKLLYLTALPPWLTACR
jgi:hypothetical protein